MNYDDLASQLLEFYENAISEFCADDKLTCDELCGCTGDCIVIQAVNAIKQLQDQLKLAIQERDAAVADLRVYPFCKTCKHNNGWNCKFHKSHECMAFDDVGKLSHPMWGWRGVKEADNG